LKAKNISAQPPGKPYPLAVPLTLPPNKTPDAINWESGIGNQAIAIQALARTAKALPAPKFQIGKAMANEVTVPKKLFQGLWWFSSITAVLQGKPILGQRHS
jgi:hypothetical protein